MIYVATITNTMAAPIDPTASAVQLARYNLESLLEILDAATLYDILDLVEMVFDLIDIPLLFQLNHQKPPRHYEPTIHYDGPYRSIGVRSIGMTKWITRRLDGTDLLAISNMPSMATPEVASEEIVYYLLRKYKFDQIDYDYIAEQWADVDPNIVRFVRTIAKSVATGNWSASSDNLANDAPYAPVSIDDNADGRLDEFLVWGRNQTSYYLNEWFLPYFLDHQPVNIDMRWFYNDYARLITNTINPQCAGTRKVLFDNRFNYTELDGHLVWAVAVVNAIKASGSPEPAAILINERELTIAEYDEILRLIENVVTGPGHSAFDEHGVNGYTAPYTAQHERRLTKYYNQIKIMKNLSINGEWRPWTAQAYNTDYRNAMRTLLMLARA
jgi:hypothetical protein